jgi:hypothetical protein
MQDAIAAAARSSDAAAGNISRAPGWLGAPLTVVAVSLGVLGGVPVPVPELVAVLLPVAVTVGVCTIENNIVQKHNGR